MPPGKIAKSQSNGEKTPQARQKKEKAVIKTPSIIKLKIKLPSVKQDATQSQNIGNDEAAKSLTERKTEEQTPSEPPSVKKRGRKKSTLQKASVKSEDALHEVNQPTRKKAVNRQRKVSPVKKISPAKLALVSDNAVKAEDAIEEVHQPIKETVAKGRRIKKNNGKQSTDQGSSVKNNASLILSSESVVGTDSIEDVKPPKKETVAKRQRVKKNNLNQSTAEGPPVENKTSPVLSSENADMTGAIEEERKPKKKTVVKRKYVKKIQNRAQSVRKVIPANLAIENDNAEDVVEEVIQPDIKKKTAVKRKWVKKNQNSEHTPGEDEPVKKKARTKLIPETNNTVKSEDTTTEVTEPVKKQKTVIKKRQRVKKVQNRKQTASQGAKKKAPPHKENSPLAPEIDNVVQTEGSQGANKVDDNEPDKLKLNEHFYDILRANQVITALFPRKQKIVTNSPIQHTLPVDTNTPKKKAVVTKAVGSKKPVSNGELVIKKKPPKVTTQRKKKPAQTKKCVSVRSKKVLKPKACNETENCSSSTKARDKKIETTEIEKPLIKQNGNSSPKTEIVKAGPKSQNLNEIIRHTKNEDTHIDNNNISVTCRRASRASSNISWAKDISTSSFSSFVTVNDFYVFDNKVPVLPLKPIDNELTNLKRKTNFSVNNSSECSENLAMNRNMKAHDLLSPSRPKTDVTKLPNEPDRNQNCVDMAEKNIAEIVATHPPVNLSSSSSSSSSTSSNSSSSSSSDDSSTAAVVSKSKDRKTLEIISRMKTNVLSKLNINKLELSPGINVEREYSNVNKVDLKNVQDKLKDLKGEIEIRRLCQAIIELEMEDVDKYFNHNGRQETTASRSITPVTYSQGALNERDNNSKEYFNENIDNNEKRSSTDKDEAVANDEIAEKIDSITVDQNKSYSSIESYPSENSYPCMQEKVRVSNEIAVKNMNNSSDRYKPTCSAYIDNDDDDALSIYADSITDLESSRKSTFHGETTEEYVPVPVVPRKEQPISYQPSKITFNNSEHETIKCASICEKQNAQPVKISATNSKGEANECTDTYEGHNADSTSLLFGSDSILDVREGSFINEDRIGEFAQYPLKTSDVTNTQATSEPRLMASIHNLSKIRSQVFKDFCYFFLKNVCKYPNCKFPHVYPFINDVKNMLARISEETFIQEYMLMRRYSKLRRKYVLCFIAEAIRRDLLRIVVEMAIDCVVKCYPRSVIDMGIKSEALEMILVYLNEVDLSTCEDLLRYAVQANDQNSVLLCDVFMGTIATSQNFTRFKQVFISLTDFMCRNGRPFSVDVAEALLERLCILPYEETLVRALLNILKKTDVTLFSNNKIQYLERQLVTANNDLYLELKSLKNKALVMQPVLGNQYDHVYEPSTVSVDKINSSLGNEQTIKPLMQNTDEINTHFGNKHTVNTPNKVNSSFGYGQSFQPLNSNEDERQTFETRNELIRNDAADFGNKNKPFETKFKMTLDLNKLRQSGFFKNENIAGPRDSLDNPFINRVLSVGENPKFNGTLRDDNIRNHSMIRPSNLGIGVKGNANQGKQGGLKNTFAIYQNTFPRAPGALQLRYPRPPYKRRLDRSFAEGGALKFPRNNGPGHFQRDMS